MPVHVCLYLVVFGKVESVVLQNLVNRTIWIRVVRGDSLSHCTSLLSLDHCSSPAIEIGETYLWEINGKKYEPLSLPIRQASDIHMFFALCNKVNETICGAQQIHAIYNIICYSIMYYIQFSVMSLSTTCLFYPITWIDLI